MEDSGQLVLVDVRRAVGVLVVELLTERRALQLVAADECALL